MELFILIKTNGEFEEVFIDRKCFLDECYKLIGCEFIEVCKPNFPYQETPIRFIIDESGKINDQKFNGLASILYNRPDILFGNVLVGKAGLNQYGEYDILGLEYYEADEIIDLLKKIPKVFVV